MGYLEELKRQADAALAQQTQDIGALQRNALLTDSACHTASRYFGTLARQLNVLQPVSKAIWRFDSRTAFSQLRFSDFRADSRLKKLRDAEVFDHVVLSFAAKTGTRVTIAKDFPPEIEKLEARLRQCGAHYDSEVIRDPENGRFVEKRFELLADFQSSVRLLPDHDCGRIIFHIANLDGFETVSVAFPAFEVGTARLDELARWINGEPHASCATASTRAASPPERAHRAAPPGRLNSLFSPRLPPCPGSGSPTSPTSAPSSTS